MVFEQLVRTTDLVNFVTDVTRERRFVEVPGRLAVPIADADEHATFYLSVLEDAPDRVAGIFEWAKRQLED